MTIVGLPEAEVRETRDRVRSALINSGLGFPSNKRIVVNLAPADLPKESGRFDLPIAIGLLAAQRLIPPQRLQGHTFAGELSLTGELRPTRGALAMAYALAPQAQDTQDAHRLILPLASAAEAALAQAATVLGARDLQQVVAYLLEQEGAAQVMSLDPRLNQRLIGPSRIARVLVASSASQSRKARTGAERSRPGRHRAR